MLYLVTGGSGSGKSEYAENLAANIYTKLDPVASAGKLYYIATMYPYDDECQKRIARHQRMRMDKGFTTIECYTHLQQIKVGGGDVILLECMSNLLANEMYGSAGQIRGENADSREADHVLKEQAEKAVFVPIQEWERKAGGVVIVTNEVFSDGMEYDTETKTYIHLLGEMNQGLATLAGSVIEVVCAIPLCRKGELPC